MKLHTEDLTVFMCLLRVLIPRFRCDGDPSLLVPTRALQYDRVDPTGFRSLIDEVEGGKIWLGRLDKPRLHNKTEHQENVNHSRPLVASTAAANRKNFMSCCFLDRINRAQKGTTTKNS